MGLGNHLAGDKEALEGLGQAVEIVGVEFSEAVLARRVDHLVGAGQVRGEVDLAVMVPLGPPVDRDDGRAADGVVEEEVGAHRVDDDSDRFVGLF